MADNVTSDPAAGGAVFATDDDGTAHHPYVKLEYGANNTQTKVAVGANALPVKETQGTSGAAPADVTVTNASTQILASNASRLWAVLVNTGTQNMRVVVGGATPTASAGVQVRPGGSFSTTNTGQINAISETATSTTAAIATDLV